MGMTPKRPLDILSTEFSDFADLQALARRVAEHAAKSARARARKESTFKRTSRRARALARIRVAAYHEDLGEALRARLEARIGHGAYLEALAAGRRLRARGVKCGCDECAGLG